MSVKKLLNSSTPPDVYYTEIEISNEHEYKFKVYDINKIEDIQIPYKNAKYYIFTGEFLEGFELINIPVRLYLPIASFKYAVSRCRTKPLGIPDKTCFYMTFMRIKLKQLIIKNICMEMK